MARKKDTYRVYLTLLFCFLQTAGIAMYSQERPRAASKRTHRHQTDTLYNVQKLQDQQIDTIISKKDRSFQAATKVQDNVIADSIAAENKKKLLEITGTPSLKELPVPADSLNKKINKKNWIPNPVKATWLALVIPGGGQIYNRKFWKLPIFYGGFAGCAYALTWNGKMYKDYSQAYKDAVNEKWDSSSITDLLPPGYIDKVSKTQLTETLRKRKDTFRRYRDMSIFAFIGVYLLSVVDAYVDAELSNFDISPDLSMRVEPAVINTQITGSSNKSVGVQCSFRF